MGETRIGIIGYGKIARDQHQPAIAGNAAFRLAAVVAPGGADDAGVPAFADHHAMLAQGGLDAVAICTPAGPRYAIARDCLDAGLDVLLEKPPAATLGQIAELEVLARDRAKVLFTTWHAQHSGAVDEAARLIAAEGLRSLDVEWLEDVEKWHPGQDWIWQPGGFGVFDPGINALSILRLLSPTRLLLTDATFVMQAAGQQPIAATVNAVAAGSGAPVSVRLDWRQKGGEQWTIAGVTMHDTTFLLSDGGKTLRIGEGAGRPGDDDEYPSIYRQFADLIATRQSHVDAEPLRLVADAFLIARRTA